MKSALYLPGAIYEIRVQGALDRDWQQWFYGLAVTLTPGDEGASVTTLLGPVPDQAALRGLLCKLWDLNLTVLAVRRVETGDREDSEHD
ncbi:MAG: hypothetical protein GX597_14725 [Anaerolineaceae bacterium]|nr:hypothetical protein [Anaerolineaceae bacterium]